MENIVEQGLLYDFYGELLTAHQRQVYEAAVYDDLSLSEIASEFGITRQGVHDLLRRCDRILQDYEDHLHLVARFRMIRAQAGEIISEARSCRQDGELSHLERIEDLAGQIRDEL